jgi:hypothetical protein
MPGMYQDPTNGNVVPQILAGPDALTASARIDPQSAEERRNKLLDLLARPVPISQSGQYIVNPELNLYAPTPGGPTGAIRRQLEPLLEAQRTGAAETQARAAQTQAETARKRTDWELEDARNQEAALRDYVRQRQASGQPITGSDLEDFAGAWRRGRGAILTQPKPPTPPNQTLSTTPPGSDVEGPTAGKKEPLPTDLQDLFKNSLNANEALAKLQTDYKPEFIQQNANKIRDLIDRSALRWGGHPLDTASPGFWTDSFTRAPIAKWLASKAGVEMPERITPNIPLSETWARATGTVLPQSQPAINEFVRRLYGRKSR